MTDRLAGLARQGRSFSWALLAPGLMLTLFVPAVANAAPQEASQPAASRAVDDAAASPDPAAANSDGTAQLAKRF